MQKKNNNKGFSLVELIVVVLIMAIIAVALAPQVMKWVKNSKITADQNTAGVIKSAAQAAFADMQAHGGSIASSEDYTIAGTNITPTSGSLYSYLNSALGGDDYVAKYGGDYDVTITSTGVVTVNFDAKGVTLE